MRIPVALFSQPRNRLPSARAKTRRPQLNTTSRTHHKQQVGSPLPTRTGVNEGWGPNPLTTGWRPRQARVTGGRGPIAATARGPSWRFGNRQGIREGPNSSMCSHPNQRLHNTALPRSRPSLDSAHSPEANHPSGTHSPNGLRLYFLPELTLAQSCLLGQLTALARDVQP